MLQLIDFRNLFSFKYQFNEFYYFNNNFMYIKLSEVHNLIRMIRLRHSNFQNFKIREFEQTWIEDEKLLQYIKDNWNNYEPFSIKEIFEIEDLQFRRMVFQYLTPAQIMTYLEAKRIGTAGYEMKSGKHNIYEMYEADVSKLDPQMRGNVYAVKCWCTTTNKEHYLWVDAKYKDDPLTAIASTAMFDENVIPKLKKFHRQGDIFLIELDEQVKLSGKIKSLTKEQYFELLDQEA